MFTTSEIRKERARFSEAEGTSPQQQIVDAFVSGEHLCMIEPEDVNDEMTENTNIICTHKKHAHAFNSQIMQARSRYSNKPTCTCSDTCVCPALHTTNIGHNISAFNLNNCDVLQAWLADENGKIDLLPYDIVADSVHCKVMITDKLDQAKLVVNDTSAIVIGMQFGRVTSACPDGIDRICLRLHAPGLTFAVGRSFTRRMYTPGHSFWKSTFPSCLAMPRVHTKLRAAP